MRFHWILLIVLIVASNASAQRALENQLGMAVPLADGKTCLLARSSHLEPGQRVSVIDFDRKTQRLFSGIIGKKAPKGCEDIGNENPLHPYEFQSKGQKQNALLGIAFIPKVQFKTRGRLIRADLNGDGRLEQFRICWSMEGAHLTAWSGIPLKSRRVWHKYYYAGYDTQANCSKKDY